MENLIRRVKSGSWVALGGTITVTIGMFLEHIEVFELSDKQEIIALIIGTAIVTQITKVLNQK